MANTPYLVKLNAENGGHTLKNGVDAMIVSAPDATTAKQMAAAQFDGDGTAWISESTATAIAAAADWEGWTFNIVILDSPALEAEYVGAAADTIDDVGAALVTELNALSAIAGAAYNSTSQTLTIAETTDGLGDMSVDITVTPPNGASGVAALLGTITDGGASGDALSVVLPADAVEVPAIVATLKQA